MNYRKITCVLITGIILFASTVISGDLDTIDQKSMINDPLFNPQNITLQDDAFHRSSRLFHLETWYFDAKLVDNISLVIVICLFQVHKTGFILHGFYLYNNSSVEFSERKITRLKNCDISYDIPSITIDDNLHIEGWIDDKTDQWKYNITYNNELIQTKLVFTKTVNGWKGEHALGWWLAIPHFSVKGTIVKENKEKAVSGRGYHDHNIYPVYVPFLTNGYHFGSFGGEILQVTWARIETKENKSELFAIITKEDMNFSLIDQSDISFEILDTIYDHGSYIPKTCRLQIDTDTIQANLTIETLTIHFIKVTGLRYWRYHLHITGFISSPSLYETINTTEISELLRFI